MTTIDHQWRVLSISDLNAQSIFPLILKMPALHRTHISFSFTSFLWDEFVHYSKLNLKLYCSWLIFPLDGNLGKLTRCYKWHHSAHLVIVLVFWTVLFPNNKIKQWPCFCSQKSFSYAVLEWKKSSFLVFLLFILTGF